MDALGAWDALMAAIGVAVWFLPWHVPAMRSWRLQWSGRLERTLAAGAAGSSALVAYFEVLAHDWQGVVASGLLGGSAGYALWRAWREHRPPGRRLRDKAGAAVRALVERMQPARTPLPVRAFGGA